LALQSEVENKTGPIRVLSLPTSKSPYKASLPCLQFHNSKKDQSPYHVRKYSFKTPRHGGPNPIFQTMKATPVASVHASITAQGMNVPNIAILVNVAKIPLAGVNPPYMKDWKAAAREPI
jgi:hypothetical protein